MSDAIPAMPPHLLDVARAARGFMPADEGDLLFAEATRRASAGPLLEVGTWCGTSAVYLGAAVRLARERGAPDAVAFTVDHHRGSEENQPGWEYHDPTLVDPHAGRIDTLPFFRRTLTDAGLEEEVVAIVGRAPTVARHWRTPLSLLFVDGGHTDEHVTNDYLGFGRWIAAGGSLVFHDVFERPEDGGQAPWRCYRRALDSKVWEETRHLGSMRVLRRIAGDAGDPLT
ncbi:class I SAM-dependent methyltransferase [Mobilicoccus massiliensis]|uniref:class I SAM-dependent methyltransferase n=1 Tax=Mobilicoccus massiliensis TaxID=1522310 RepID=UPI00058D9420|nr:class I SAM-dependent methyltransferase [Mobilicoccus massiliensis]